jgi:uncharacterized protein
MRWLLLPFLFVSSLAFAAEPKIPALTRPVMDEAQLFSAPEVAQMESFIREVKAKTQAQFQVLTVSSLEGFPIEEYSIKVTDQWKLGDAKRDDGLLLLIAPQDRQVRIEVGQGLEGTIPDITAARIIRNEIVPSFKQSDYAGGAYRALRQLAVQIDPEFKNISAEGPAVSENPYASSQGSRRRGRTPPWVYGIFLLIFILSRLMGFGRRSRGAFSSWTGGGGFGGGSGWGGGGGGFSGGGSSGRW